MMIAVQALEKRSSEQTQEIKKLSAENADLKARLEGLEQLVRSKPYLTAATAPIQ